MPERPAHDVSRLEEIAKNTLGPVAWSKKRGALVAGIPGCWPMCQLRLRIIVLIAANAVLS